MKKGKALCSFKVRSLKALGISIFALSLIASTAWPILAH